MRISAEDLQFRKLARDWILANLPESLRDTVDYPSRTDLQPWLSRLSDRGWIAPNWPAEHGGMGAPIAHRRILMHELVNAGAPTLVSPGVNFVGPLLMEYGTDAQRQYHLPLILTGESSWAQGYSEPNAGSDLASISTSARLDGDHFVVSGHKVWQTWGQYADWMLTLVRTDNSGPKQAGISMLIIDLRSPGVKVSPIRTITHEDELSEVFLNDVRVPRSNMIGELHQGWSLANSLLVHERLSGGSPELSLAMMSRVNRVAAHTGALRDPVIKDRVTAAEIDLISLEETYWNCLQRFEAGDIDAATTSTLKFAQTRIQQTLADLLLEVAGADATQSYIVVDGRRVPIAAAFLLARRATIFGGTREIQLNIIARHTLGLKSQ